MRPVRKKKDVCNIYENPVPYVLIGNTGSHMVPQGGPTRVFQEEDCDLPLVGEPSIPANN